MANPAPSLSEVFNRPSEEFVNDPDIEGLWAIKAVEHMQIYFNLISAIDPKVLRLTPKDDLIYEEFRKQFEHFAVDRLDIKSLKADEVKEQWRTFCTEFEGEVEDFNYATMLRLDCTKDYDESNSIVVPRIQFLAIEIARNREGYNEGIRASIWQEECPLKISNVRKKVFTVATCIFKQT
ncbi:Protein PBDC1 [Halotydeus destructor]|nr:Protein PBDC1 [Halotydeus destructor]